MRIDVAFEKICSAAVGLIFKAVIMNNEWQVIECRGYKACVEIDFDRGTIIGRIYNFAWSDHRIEFSADSITELYEEFEKTLDEYYDMCNIKGIEPRQPRADALPPIVFKHHSQWFPELVNRIGSDPIQALSIIDRKLSQLRRYGFLDIVSIEQNIISTKEDIFDAIKMVSWLIGIFVPKNSRLWWLINRLVGDVELVKDGNQPIYLKVDPYKGTKSGSPKHVALRIECACAVAALIRRGMTRDAACKAVHGALANAGISANKNGKPISVRTVLAYYESERISARKNGPIDYEIFPSPPKAAPQKEFYIENSNNIFEQRFAFEADQESDLSRRLKNDVDKDYTQGNGPSPLEIMISNLKAIGPLA
ncbi:MAG: hypothetical protein GX458_21400 [Phyllobacteriaceae bacterium]|nr:hypothetical protein [Phyllobacteriaceae bacterium]